MNLISSEPQWTKYFYLGEFLPGILQTTGPFLTTTKVEKKCYITLKAIPPTDWEKKKTKASQTFYPPEIEDPHGNLVLLK